LVCAEKGGIVPHRDYCGVRRLECGIAYVVGSAVYLVARRGWLKLQTRILATAILSKEAECSSK
jgi:hypothetical protein